MLETKDAEVESRAAPETETSAQAAERWRRRDLRHHAFENKTEFAAELLKQPAARGAMGYVNYVLTQVRSGCRRAALCSAQDISTHLHLHAHHHSQLCHCSSSTTLC